MEFRKIEPGVFKFENKGDEIIGKLVKVGESSKYGKGKVYHLEKSNDETGEVENVVIFGTKVLDDRMGFVEVGQYVKIVYKGEEPTKNGQNAKIFEVSVAVSNE